MNLITLTTDLGWKDFYVALVKGELLKNIPGVSIIDITHEIESYSSTHAAYVLVNSYRHFPNGTIHLAGVDTNNYYAMKHLVIQHHEQFFIGPDNGLFSLVFENDMPDQIFHLAEEIETGSMPISGLYVQTAKAICEGKKLNEFCKSLNQMVVVTSFRPIINQNYIKGTVIHIDKFENVILNIRKNEFEDMRQNRKFIVSFKRNNDIDKLEINYGSITEGQISCMVNSGGNIELFMKHGNMASLLGLKVNDTVQIEFK